MRPSAVLLAACVAGLARATSCPNTAAHGIRSCAPAQSANCTFCTRRRLASGRARARERANARAAPYWFPGPIQGQQFIKLPEGGTECELQTLQEHCVARINQYRTGVLTFTGGGIDCGIPNTNLTSASANAQCENELVLGDLYLNVLGHGGCAGVHSSFQACPAMTGAVGQNACCLDTYKSMSDVTNRLDACLQLMWDEGKGQDCANPVRSTAIGHWLNMRDPTYTYASCGFAFLASGGLLMEQNFASSFSPAPPTASVSPTTVNETPVPTFRPSDSPSRPTTLSPTHPTTFAPTHRPTPLQTSPTVAPTCVVSSAEGFWTNDSYASGLPSPVPPGIIPYGRGAVTTNFLTMPQTMTECELDDLHMACVNIINDFRSGARGFSDGAVDCLADIGGIAPLTQVDAHQQCENSIALGELSLTLAQGGEDQCFGAFDSMFACSDFGTNQGMNACCLWSYNASGTDAYGDVLDKLDACLQSMWDTGAEVSACTPYTGVAPDSAIPYINMRSQTYNYVSCGFAFTDQGDLWMTQSFAGAYASPTSQPSTATTTSPTLPSRRPTSHAPTTRAPSTKSPLSKAPSTKKPASQKPTTHKPTTRKPTTSKPTTHKPTTHKPTTHKPTTHKPSTTG